MMILITNISEIEKEAESCDWHGEDLSIELRKLSTSSKIWDLQTVMRQLEAKFSFPKRQTPRCWRRKENPNTKPIWFFSPINTYLLSTYYVPGKYPRH